MALLASQARVTPGQRELGFIVIEGDILPVSGLMAGGAVCSEFAAMFIILFMTGETISRRALEYIVDMALFTLHINMRALQLEGGKVVIKLCWLPAINGVTSRAIRAKPTFMRLVSAMAEVAILR